MSQIKLKGLAANAVNSGKIVDGSVATADIGADQVTGAKILLANNEALRSRNQANSADIPVLLVNASDELNVLKDIGLVTVAGPATIENKSGTYALNVKSGPTAGLSLHTGVVSVKSGDASGTTSNSGNIVLETGTATGARGNIVLDGTDVNATAVGDINLAAGDDIIATGDVLNMSAMEMFHIATNAADPTGTAEGQMYYNSTSNKVRYYDGSVWADVGSTAAIDYALETVTLSAGNITDQYVDMSFAAVPDTVDVKIDGLAPCIEGGTYDYQANATGGVAGVLRVLFGTRTQTGGVAELVAGDLMQVRYLKA